MSLADFKTPHERARLLAFRELLHTWEAFAMRGPDCAEMAVIGLACELQKLLPQEGQFQQPEREGA